MKKMFVRRLAVVPLFTLMPALFSCAAEREDVFSCYAKAKDMYARGLFSQAAGLLEKRSGFVPALILKAKAEYFSGDLVKAEASFRRAIRRRPSAFEAKFYLAMILRNRGDLLQAEKIARDLIADNPRDIKTARFASELARDLGKIPEAQVLLDQAVELSAESAMVFLERARRHWESGRKVQALEDLEKAGAILPHNTPLAKSVESLLSTIKEASH